MIENRFLKDYPPPYPYYASTNNNSFGANGGLYNRNGRGFPDVSALGDNIATFTYGEFMPNAGTSASKFYHHTHTHTHTRICMHINIQMKEGKKEPI